MGAAVKTTLYKVNTTESYKLFQNEK